MLELKRVSHYHRYHRSSALMRACEYSPHPLGPPLEPAQVLALPLPMARGSKGLKVVNDSGIEAATIKRDEEINANLLNR